MEKGKKSGFIKRKEYQKQHGNSAQKFNTSKRCIHRCSFKSILRGLQRSSIVNLKFLLKFFFVSLIMMKK